MNHYEIVGKYINKENEVVAYALRNVEARIVEDYVKESVYFMVGRGQILNCRGSLSKGKVVLNGVGCDLSSLPVKPYTENQADVKSQGIAETDKGLHFKPKSSVKEKLNVYGKFSEELALNYALLGIIENRNIQCTSYPVCQNYNSSDKEYEDGLRHKAEICIYSKKLSEELKIEVRALKSRKIRSRTGYMYSMIIYSSKGTVLYQNDIKPNEVLKNSNINPYVGYGYKSSESFYVISERSTGKKIANEFLDWFNSNCLN